MVIKNRNDKKWYSPINQIDTAHNPRLTVVSLFSGAGGLDIGLEQAGYDTKVCVEIDKHCRETLRVNRPSWNLIESDKDHKGNDRVPGDIRMISGNEILTASGMKRGEVGLVVGGAPCQPFSNMGKKKGKHDEKNGDLFLEFVRVVKEIHPYGFVFENVSGITQARHNEVISYMKEQFAGWGYALSYSVLNAAHYGVPQKRERFFFIGVRGISTEPAFPLPTHFKNKIEWEHFHKSLEGDFMTDFKGWVNVKRALKKIKETSKNRDDYALMNVSDIVKRRMAFVGPGQNFKVLPMEMRPNCWKTGKHQGADTFGRLKEEEPAVTIRTAAYNPSKGRYIHPTENRGLSSIEMAVLQDFPLSWKFQEYGKRRITLVNAGRQIGNAVPPGLARAIGLCLKHQILQVWNQERIDERARAASPRELTVKTSSTAA